MTKKAKLNGGVDALALAMRQVFNEAIEANNQPIMESMEKMEGRLGKRMDTTDENMSAQFAQQEKKFSDFLKAATS